MIPVDEPTIRPRYAGRIFIATNEQAIIFGKLALQTGIVDALIVLSDPPSGSDPEVRVHITYFVSDRGTAEERAELERYIRSLIRRSAEADGCTAVDKLGATPRA